MILKDFNHYSSRMLIDLSLQLLVKGYDEASKRTFFDTKCSE
jgi:hypothetical protein